mmetsp:Transcript_21329/g.53709  ORF Transcript_21329/g.53709 Transcript_21329/m.53709 type:complete len:372 (-) Transcript_21329:65-1180(-)
MCAAQDVPHERFFDNYTEVGYEAAQRYRIQMQLGKGAEGTVVGAVDVATGTEVAIKKLKNIAKNTHHANNILREVMLSNGMAGLGGVVQVKRFIPPSDTGNFSTLFIVMERMAGNLFDEKEITRGFDLRTQKWLAYQMLSALQSMHAAGFLHRDISPTNVFVKSDCSVKLGDFGMTRVIRSYTPEDFKDGQMNMPPQTNWIEDPAVDVFHMGKTILSMACGANRMYKQQDRDKFVRAMLKEHGRPPEHVLVKLSPPAMAVIRSSADKDDDGSTFESFWPEVHPDILRLAKRMLLWDLREIPSAADLMLDTIFDEIMDLRGPRVGPQDLAARPWNIRRSLGGGKIFKALSKGMGIIDADELLADVPDVKHAP